jgi:hypothetical protein
MESPLIIRSVGRDCQARGTKVRFIHHRESLYPLPGLASAELRSRKLAGSFAHLPAVWLDALASHPGKLLHLASVPSALDDTLLID